MKPGRKSTADLVVIPSVVRRFEPPRELTPEQSEIWRAVVATKPADWFEADSLPLLTAYCKAVSEHSRVSGCLDAFETEWLKGDEGIRRYDALTRMQDRLASQMVRLATKMRLTQQSRYRADAADVANNRAGRKRPWEE